MAHVTLERRDGTELLERGARTIWTEVLEFDYDPEDACFADAILDHDVPGLGHDALWVMAWDSASSETWETHDGWRATVEL